MLLRDRLRAFSASIVLVSVVSLAWFLVPRHPVSAETFITPHGSYPGTITPPSAPGFQQDTHLCALCHWSHGALAIDLGRREQVPLCFTCHGAEGLGSNYPVQSDFNKASSHSLDPSIPPFGPSPKRCGDCHNPHGDRDAEGKYYAKLLRSRDSTDPVFASGTPYYEGSSYCGACHEGAPAPYGVSVDLYESTPHYAGVAEPASGTKVRCLACHEQHGSDIAPLLAPVTNGTTITANDRTECYACHPLALRSYDGSATYDGSAHGRATGSLAGRPVSACQQCHDPHGARDLNGLFPRLTRRLEESVCRTCHDLDGPAADDIYSRFPTAGASPRYEVVSSVTPTEHAGADNRLAVLSQETSGGPPRALRGPYEVAVPAGALSLAIGDVDGDGRSEAVAGTRGSASLVIGRQSALSGVVSTQSVSTVARADDLAIGDVTGDGSADAVFVSREGDLLAVYGWSGATLSLVDTYTTGGGSPSALAIGDVDGDGRLDVVVANAASDNIGWLKQNAGGAFDAPVTYAAEASPTGVAVADLDLDGDAEVVVANSGADSVRVFTYAAGALSVVGTYGTSSASGATPRDVTTGDLLAGYAGREVVVTLSQETSQSGLNVFSSSAGGALTFRQEATTGVQARTRDVAIADVDGDGSAEVAVGNGGGFLVLAPGVGVFSAASATTLSLQMATAVGASQDGGGHYRMAVGDLGNLYPYRHDVTAVQRAHESTEVTVPPAARHVECQDCHNSMVADTSTAAPPLVAGALEGAYGVAVSNGAAGTPPDFSAAQPVVREYEVCFKCHSSLAGESGDGDVATAMNPANASYHPVEAVGTNTTIAAGAWESGWDAASRTYCTDCHASSDAAAPLGPHHSDEPRILVGTYVGAAPAASGACWGCHRRGAYYDGDEATATPASRFYDGRYATPQLHSFHLKTKRLDCRACHVVHGSATQPHLIRADIGYSHDSTGGPNGGGSCVASGCHAATQYYQALYP